MYKVMASLERKDLVVSHPGKPRRYRLVDLGAVEEQLVTDIKEGFDALRRRRGSMTDMGTPQLVYTIMGPKRVMAKIGEMIDDAMVSIFLSSPDMRVLRSEHGQRLSEAVKRGVHVVVVMEPFMKSPDCSECHRREGLFITDLVVDNEYSLLATPDFEICGFIEDPFITRHLESILRSSIS
jgi:sugar-specific transcriptional regulator TrmB